MQDSKSRFIDRFAPVTKVALISGAIAGLVVGLLSSLALNLAAGILIGLLVLIAVVVVTSLAMEETPQPPEATTSFAPKSPISTETLPSRLDQDKTIVIEPVEPNDKTPGS